jgi:hypothetical protein
VWRKAFDTQPDIDVPGLPLKERAATLAMAITAGRRQVAR